jgi:hypothetical protein
MHWEEWQSTRRKTMSQPKGQGHAGSCKAKSREELFFKVLDMMTSCQKHSGVYEPSLCDVHGQLVCWWSLI